jgi:ubiquinol-cytochrome c reductase cytochrome b subunit
LGALAAPLVGGGLLFAIPLFDRGPSRHPSTRKPYLGAVALLFAVALGLGLAGLRADRQNAAYQRFRVRAEKESARALALAQGGVPPAGGVAVYDNDPTTRARKLYEERCAGCHPYAGAGERRAPELDGWSGRAWLRAFLKDPESPRFFGATRIRGMKPVKAEGADLDALVEWVYAGGADAAEPVDAAKVARGKELFATSGCDDCHDTDGVSGGEGQPNLGGRASPAWIREFLLDPSGDRFFGAKKNQMTRFRGKLSESDLDALVAWLRGERAR